MRIRESGWNAEAQGLPRRRAAEMQALTVLGNGCNLTVPLCTTGTGSAPGSGLPKGLNQAREAQVPTRPASLNCFCCGAWAGSAAGLSSITRSPYCPGLYPPWLVQIRSFPISGASAPAILPGEPLVSPTSFLSLSLHPLPREALWNTAACAPVCPPPVVSCSRSKQLISLSSHTNASFHEGGDFIHFIVSSILSANKLCLPFNRQTTHEGVPERRNE